MATTNELKGGTAQRQRIDAMVLAKTLVLISEQYIKETWIDIGHFCRQTPTAFAGGVGSQQAAIAIEHRLRELEVIAERCRSQRDDPQGQRSAKSDASQGKNNANDLRDASKEP